LAVDQLALDEWAVDESSPHEKNRPFPGIGSDILREMGPNCGSLDGEGPTDVETYFLKVEHELIRKGFMAKGHRRSRDTQHNGTKHK
jgi:hypothetical protein